MPDVIHDPETDWCACEPDGTSRCSYRLLADCVGDALNPPDGDEGEVSLLMTAVEQIATYVRGLPCACTLMMLADGEPCRRCGALGQLGGKPVQR